MVEGDGWASHDFVEEAGGVGEESGSRAADLVVLCSESELQENGEVVEVGEYVSREAGRREGTFYGGELDEIVWQFDQYARVVGYDAATISGRVVSIQAVYVHLTLRPDGWGPRPGSAHLEALESTANTRSIPDEIVWGARSLTDEQGHSYATGYPMIREGDEHLSGWLFTLQDASVVSLPGAEELGGE